ncbi:RB1-inducible coiled-coil protein 1 [Onthophagus taurus]|uniref:RB1-inducible coiled-coil protein 1 n=1 Tax=Onthophagus taurus TaxID=166361 RepID=UPI0039BE5405
MMLFVFHVDRGTMMTFNMQAALYSVGELKEKIHQLCKIPPEKQVLLVSGGRGLYSENKVCSYSGGTDSNPIFLFYKYGINDELQLTEDTMYNSESEILSKVHDAVRDPEMTHAVVARRATLAEQLYDIAEEYLTQCKKLVHDQHLQQQGWMAVVANLEDTTMEFKQRAESYEETFNHYYSSYGEYIHLVQGFNEDLKLLSKIPLLPALLTEKDVADRDDEDISNDEEEIQADAMKPTSLLEYITSSESNQQMEQLFDMCTTGLQQFDEKVHNRMRVDIAEVLSLADDPEMKEVKGLGERLYGLDKLIRDGESCVLEQKQQTKSFTSNNLTIAKTGEKSIIPDLCSSHTLQLQAMGTTHQKLCDITRRVIKAKEELIKNLFMRLKWVMYVENKILETSQKLFVCHENLKRLCRQLDMLHQIHNAPTLYLNGISEVVRRKAFSKAFLLWASDLACRMMTIHNDEKARRKDFAAAAEGHFLATLFPDSNDTIPAFAVEPPSVFDSNLPAVSEEDVQAFKDSLPEALRNEFKLYDLSTVMEFFIIKEGKNDFVQTGSQTMDVVEQTDFTGNVEGVPKNLDVAVIPLLKDLDRGCESETDTEEFEKVCQSPLELQFDREVQSVPRTQDIGTLTEDNLQSSRIEYDRVKGSLTQLSSFTQQALVNLRRELSDLKEYFITEQEVLAKHCGDLTESWEQVSSGNEVKDKQMAILISENDELLKNFKRELDSKNEELKQLRIENEVLDRKNKDFFMDNCYLKSEVDNLKTQSSVKIENLTRTLADKDVEKERSLQLLREENKAEIETLRSRFKLMTESTSSDTNLERVWNAEMESRMEQQIRLAVLNERGKWEKIIANLNATNENLIREKQTLLNDQEEKDNLIKHLKEEIEQFHRNQKETEVMEFKDDLSASVMTGISEASKSEPMDVSKVKDTLTMSQKSLIATKKLNVTKCNIGDLVLVLWDSKHDNYKILQESSTMYFLHSDSLVPLGLKRGEKGKLYTWGQVTHKDYCHARKAQNRYNVQVGTKFYRVKVNPVIIMETIEKMEELRESPILDTNTLLTVPERNLNPDGATTSSTRSSSTMTCSFSIHSPEPLQMDTSTSSSSNRTHTFTYCLSDPWLGGSAW